MLSRAEDCRDIPPTPTPIPPNDELPDIKPWRIPPDVEDIGRRLNEVRREFIIEVSRLEKDNSAPPPARYGMKPPKLPA
jgi:hypothetical protein